MNNRVDGLYRVMTKPWVILLYFSVVVISYYFWDKPIAQFMHTAHLEQRYPWLLWITKLAAGGPYLVGLLLIAALCRFGIKNTYWRDSVFLWLCVLVPSLINLVLKVILARARPTLWLGQSLYGFQWFKFKAAYWSFPSGHTVTIMGLIFGLSMLYPRHFKSLFIMGLLIVSTRVLLIAHFLSDVMVAMYLSLITVVYLRRVLESKAQWGRELFTNRLGSINE